MLHRIASCTHGSSLDMMASPSCSPQIFQYSKLTHLISRGYHSELHFWLKMSFTQNSKLASKRHRENGISMKVFGFNTRGLTWLMGYEPKQTFWKQTYVDRIVGSTKMVKTITGHWARSRSSYYTCQGCTVQSQFYHATLGAFIMWHNSILLWISLPLVSISLVGITPASSSVTCSVTDSWIDVQSRKFWNSTGFV